MNKERLVKLVKESKAGDYNPSVNDVVLWYDTLNEHVFDSSLPKLSGVQFCRTKNYWGEISCHRYKNNGKLRIDFKLSENFESFKDFVEVMAHEMVHAWEYDNFTVMGHGERFFSWEPKLKRLGLTLSATK